MSTEYIADDTEVVPPGELCCIGEGPPLRGPHGIADDAEVVPPATEGPPQAETPRLGDGASWPRRLIMLSTKHGLTIAEEGPALKSNPPAEQKLTSLGFQVNYQYYD
jgi:hypothetical protein